jgi:hypothetical protein
MGTVRAHFYASFHSSRTRERKTGKATEANSAWSNPITRETIANISCVSPRTQRLYEKKANVQKRSNYAIGAKSTPAREEEQAWRHGHALFRLTDHKGKQGKPGVTYLAWQLPNTYLGPHVPKPRGRQKQINQELTDLFTKGMTGNGQERIEDGTFRHQKCFYGNGHMAAKAYNRSNRQDVYWRSRSGTRHGRSQLWYHLPAAR